MEQAAPPKEGAGSREPEEAERRSEQVQRWCPTWTAPALIGSQPFCLEGNTAQVPCIPSEGLLATARPFSAAGQSALSWGSFEMRGVGVSAPFPLPVSQCCPRPLSDPGVCQQAGPTGQSLV